MREMGRLRVEESSATPQDETGVVNGGVQLWSDELMNASRPHVRVNRLMRQQTD
jgi:hypothetical protein